jgi:hypothetical protein
VRESEGREQIQPLVLLHTIEARAVGGVRIDDGEGVGREKEGEKGGPIG